jgi:hypothetical protein
MGKITELASAVTEGVKVNAAWREVRAGRGIWLKRRRSIGGPILKVANTFFRLAQAQVQALAVAAEWQAWEVESFQRLHGAEGFRVFAEGPQSVGAEEMPGVNLTTFLDGDAMTPQMSAAAGRELRRAHGFESPVFGGGWSHGDAHAGNFMYEPAADRARLIDFELRHVPTLSTAARQRDDVLGFLLDMVGRIEEERWQPCAEAFLEGYGCERMRAEIATERAIAARGAAGVWLRVRTTFLAPAELRRRWAMLAERVPAVEAALP